MKYVFSTTEFVDYQLIRLALGDHGIDARLENEGAALYGIGMPTSAAPIQISVRDEDEEKARIVIHDFFEQRKKKRKKKEEEKPDSSEDPSPKTTRRKRIRYLWMWLIGGAAFVLFLVWDLKPAILVAALAINVIAILALRGGDD